MSLQSQFNRVKAVHRKLFPPPKAEIWLPLGVYVREPKGDEEREDKEGNLLHYFHDNESEATYDRCQKLGIIPNVYIVSDEWHPDMDDIEA